MKALTEIHGHYCYRPAAWIVAEGEDAHEFLQSQFSNDLSEIQIGQSIYGLWLDQKGKVHGDSFVCRTDEEEFRLLSYSTPETTILEKLNGFIVADDVELSGHAEEVAGISLVGNAVKLMDSLGLENGEGGISDLIGGPAFILTGRRGAQPAIEIITNRHGSEVLLERLQQADSSLDSLDETTMEVLRVAGICPSIPKDIGPDELPQEGGLESDAVSFTKGCYLGQEVMSRLHSMGKARRSLRLARTAKSVSNGSLVYLGEKKVGIVRTSVRLEEWVMVLVLLSNSIQENETLVVREAGESVPISLES